MGKCGLPSANTKLLQNTFHNIELGTTSFFRFIAQFTMMGRRVTMRCMQSSYTRDANCPTEINTKSKDIRKRHGSDRPNELNA